MLTRFAMFEGQLKPGAEPRMRVYVQEKLAPLWRQFTGASDVKVHFGVQQDPKGPVIPLVLAVRYADHDAMAKALDSLARYESRDLLPEFYDCFFENVQLWHYLMEDCPD